MTQAARMRNRARWPGGVEGRRMRHYQREFIELARRAGALEFGEFTLKSGRKSPYFFNSGTFCDGASLGALASGYAQAIVASGLEFDALFGPAYKGIPLAAAVAVCLAREHGRNVPFAYNRKEAKRHGEGGTLVGAPLAGRVVVVDDVISAGTAMREALGLIARRGARCVGAAVALDRQERGRGERPASEEIEREFGLRVVSILRLAELVEYLRASGAGMAGPLRAMEAYQAAYGAG